MPLRSFRLTQEAASAFTLEVELEGGGEAAARELAARVAAALRVLGWPAPAVAVAPLAPTPGAAKPEPFRAARAAPTAR